MFSGERKTVISVLSIYLISTFLLVFTVFGTYFFIEKEKYKIALERSFEKDAIALHQEFKILHGKFFSQKIEYPKNNNFKSAIYDIDKDLIYSNMETKKIDWSQKIYSYNGKVVFIYNLSPYYLGAAYVVLEKEGVSFLDSFDKRILFVPFGILLLIILTSYGMVKIILKPIQKNIQALDHFIKDTTHELNTPIATIQSNLELLENISFDTKVERKLNRIRIATINIKKLYEELVFLTLHKSNKQDIETIFVKEIISERIEYFKLLLDSKNIIIDFKATHNPQLLIDHIKFVRLIDNLLSNAIKYSNKDTQIKIIVFSNGFSIEDQGIGMSEEDLQNIFTRYTRFSKDDNNGFGIGYNIIYQILNEYNLNIDIDSKKGLGTCIKISW